MEASKSAKPIILCRALKDFEAAIVEYISWKRDLQYTQEKFYFNAIPTFSVEQMTPYSENEGIQ